MRFDTALRCIAPSTSTRSITRSNQTAGATLPTAAMVECLLRGVVVAWSGGRGAAGGGHTAIALCWRPCLIQASQRYGLTSFLIYLHGGGGTDRPTLLWRSLPASVGAPAPARRPPTFSLPSFSAATTSPPPTRRAASTVRLTRLLLSSDLLRVCFACPVGLCLGSVCRSVVVPLRAAERWDGGTRARRGWVRRVVCVGMLSRVLLGGVVVEILVWQQRP